MHHPYWTRILRLRLDWTFLIRSTDLPPPVQIRDEIPYFFELVATARHEDIDAYVQSRMPCFFLGACLRLHSRVASVLGWHCLRKQKRRLLALLLAKKRQLHRKVSLVSKGAVVFPLGYTHGTAKISRF